MATTMIRTPATTRQAAIVEDFCETFLFLFKVFLCVPVRSSSVFRLPVPFWTKSLFRKHGTGTVTTYHVLFFIRWGSWDQDPFLQLISLTGKKKCQKINTGYRVAYCNTNSSKDYISLTKYGIHWRILSQTNWRSFSTPIWHISRPQQ